MRILAIGNSFSDDATARLHDFAAAGGLETTVVNLYIGGCPLKLHWENALADSASYRYSLNGEALRESSIRAALEEGGWDVVTLQQFSGESGVIETYYPYVALLSGYVRALAPNAAQWIHQTWAYDVGAEHPHYARYGSDQRAMFAALEDAYGRVAADLGLKVIPVGRAVQALRALPVFDLGKGGRTLCRDGHHLDFIYGRYAASAVWCETLLGMDVRDNPYVPAREGMDAADPELLALIRRTVHAAAAQDNGGGNGH